MPRQKRWHYSSKKVWPTVTPDEKDRISGRLEGIANGLVFRYFATHNNRSLCKLTSITQHWRRHYCYLIAHYQDHSSKAINRSFDIELARIEYFSPNKLTLSYFRHTGVWFEVARDLRLAGCCNRILDDPIFHPLF